MLSLLDRDTGYFSVLAELNLLMRKDSEPKMKFEIKKRRGKKACFLACKKDRGYTRY